VELIPVDRGELTAIHVGAAGDLWLAAGGAILHGQAGPSPTFQQQDSVGLEPKLALGGGGGLLWRSARTGSSSAANADAAHLPPNVGRDRFCTTSGDPKIAVGSYGSGPLLVRAGTWLTHVECPPRIAYLALKMVDIHPGNIVMKSGGRAWFETPG
jgi:hypothetical protein